MNLRPYLRRFLCMQIGDGRDTNAWEDTWLQCGQLSDFISYRFIHGSGFHTSTTVREVLMEWDGAWPNEWMSRHPILSNVVLPSLNDNMCDRLGWKGNRGNVVEFSVSEAFHSLVGVQPTVVWTKAVWFSGFIPKHAFVLWLACRGRLPTQDRILSWKHDPPDMKCSLCGVCIDSHGHLFFDCPFSAHVWKEVTKEVSWPLVPASWDAILVLLSDQQQRPRIFLHRLALAATVYMIWKERNRRLFSNQKCSEIQLVKEILNLIKSRQAWWMCRKNGKKLNDGRM